MNAPRNKRNRNNSDRFLKSWSSSNHVKSRRSPRPPGLRGKEIGLYYRDRGRANAKKNLNDHISVNLTIPPAHQLKINNILESLQSDWKNDSETEFHFNHDNILPLRQNMQYKYGYSDIITGSFQEKLDENMLLKQPIGAMTTDTVNNSSMMLEEYKEMLKNAMYKEKLLFRERLPTYKKHSDILDLIHKNQVIVISGETGCGKSTQVPQIILDDAIVSNRGANTRIVVTQPRRIAASSLAARVSEERGEPHMGHTVGYTVRLESVPPRNRGSILFCTTGVLLNDIEVNQGLTDISHVILDEVHERDTNIDLTMAVLKQILVKRKDLKIILMSATLDAENLSKYFNCCPKLHIEGLAFPVKDYYMEDVLAITDFRIHESQTTRKKKRKVAKYEEEKMAYRAQIGEWINENSSKYSTAVLDVIQNPEVEKLNLDLIVELIKHICGREPGAILVFLPGISDISKLISILGNSRCFPPSYYNIYPLHSKLPTLQQKVIFERPPLGVRKIIIATNIAETSITIDDIVYVIDCGLIKMSGFDATQHVATLKAETISITNLRQRRGRAGRVQPGICYHLLTSYRVSKLDERPLPELQRSNLLEAILTIKKLRLGKAAEALANVPDPPSADTIKWAVTILQRYGALNADENLTPLGWHLARLPVHPAAGKLLVLGAMFGCLDRCATVAACCGFKDPFMFVIGKEKEANDAKIRFAQGELSDHIAMSEAVRAWEMNSYNRLAFCYQNFLANNTIQLLVEMKNQFGRNLRDMGFLPTDDINSPWENRHDNNLSLFKGILAACLYPNVAKVKWSGKRKTKVGLATPEDGRVVIHPGSVTSTVAPGGGRPRSESSVDKHPLWAVYWLKQRSTNLFLHDVTFVHTLPVLFFGEHLTMEDATDRPGYHVLHISTFKICCDRNAALLILRLRRLLDRVLATRINTPNATKLYSHSDDTVLSAVIQLITAEDEGQEDLDDDSESDSSSGASSSHGNSNASGAHSGYRASGHQSSYPRWTGGNYNY